MADCAGALFAALLLAVALPTAAGQDMGKGRGGMMAPGGKVPPGGMMAGRGPPPPKLPPVQPGESPACRLMWPLWQSAAVLLGGSSSRKLTAEECTNLHEFYMGPRVPPEGHQIGFKLPRDALGYVQVYKSASTEILCNLRKHFGQRERWKRGRSRNPMHIMLQLSLFPLRSPLGDEDGWKGKYYEDTPEDIQRAKSQGRTSGRGTVFTFVRDPGARFVSGVSEIEYYLIHGEPEAFGDMVLGTKAAKANYEKGSIIRDAKAQCIGCRHYDLEAGSDERAHGFVLDLAEGRMQPHFLWRHVSSQVNIINAFSRNVGPFDLIGQLESFDEGWEAIEAIAGAGVVLPPFNRSCKGHDYSSSESKFAPRETMKRLVKQRVPDASGKLASSDVARALGCSILLPDYACFGYPSIVNASECVDAGFAASVAEWAETVEKVREELCPVTMAKNLEGFAHVRGKRLSQDIGRLPMPSPAPTSAPTPRGAPREEL